MRKIWDDEAWDDYWEIDKKNRIVYKIENGEVRIAQCGSHYRDK